jgi:regulator of RNase E activity RraA
MDLGRLIEELRAFPTGVLAKTLRLGDPAPRSPYCLPGEIQALMPSLGPTVGVAFTCRLDSSSPIGQHDPTLDDAEAYYMQVEAMARLGLPSVWVLKTAGSRPEHECVLGEGDAKFHAAAGCVGALSDGGVRDLPGLRKLPMAVHCRGTTIHHCALQFGAFDQPVEIGGVRIVTGDLIHAGAGGAIRIPAECLDGLPARARRVEALLRDGLLWLGRRGVGSADKRTGLRDLVAEHGWAAPETASTILFGLA